MKAERKKENITNILDLWLGWFDTGLQRWRSDWGWQDVECGIVHDHDGQKNVTRGLVIAPIEGTIGLTVRTLGELTGDVQGG
jgi:hypothetical protein